MRCGLDPQRVVYFSEGDRWRSININNLKDFTEAKLTAPAMKPLSCLGP